MDNEYNDRKTRSGFGRGLLIYLLILVLLFGGLLAGLWKKLSDYQQGIDAKDSAKEQVVLEEPEIREDPQKAPQEYFLQYVSAMSEDDWAGLYYETRGNHLDSEDSVRALILEKITAPGFECFRDADFTVEQPVYVVMNQEESLARFSLEKSGGDWGISKSELLIGGDVTAGVCVPKQYQVMFNGSELTEDFVKEETGFSDVNDYEDKLENPVTYVTYEAEGLLSEPEITVELTDDSYSAAKGFDGKYYLAMSDEKSSDYQSRAKAFIESLLHYYTVGKDNAEANLSGVLSHVSSGSRAAAIIRASLDGVMWRPADYSISYETETSDAYLLADNCYAVDVTYWDKGKEEEKQVYRVFFLDSGNGFGIVQFAAIDPAE